MMRTVLPRKKSATSSPRAGASARSVTHRRVARPALFMTFPRLGAAAAARGVIVRISAEGERRRFVRWRLGRSRLKTLWICAGWLVNPSEQPDRDASPHGRCRLVDDNGHSAIGCAAQEIHGL